MSKSPCDGKRGGRNKRRSSEYREIRPMRVEMYCKVIRCSNEILHQVRNDGLG